MQDVRAGEHQIPALLARASESLPSQRPSTGACDSAHAWFALGLLDREAARAKRNRKSECEQTKPLQVVVLHEAFRYVPYQKVAPRRVKVVGEVGEGADSL